MCDGVVTLHIGDAVSNADNTAVTHISFFMKNRISGALGFVTLGHPFSNFDRDGTALATVKRAHGDEQVGASVIPVGTVISVDKVHNIALVELNFPTVDLNAIRNEVMIQYSPDDTQIFSIGDSLSFRELELTDLLYIVHKNKMHAGVLTRENYTKSHDSLKRVFYTVARFAGVDTDLIGLPLFACPTGNFIFAGILVTGPDFLRRYFMLTADISLWSSSFTKQNQWTILK